MAVAQPLMSDARTTVYRPDIDGLRALAILPVVLFHAGVSFFPGGFAGVDVFFVISGFLIGSHVFQEMKAGRFSLARFYFRRARRIVPAFVLVIGVLYVPAALLFSGAELREFSKEALTALTSTSNVYYAAARSNYFASSAGLNPLLMTWSLGVEEQFYLGFPFLLAIMLRLLGRRVLLGLILLSSASFLLSVYLSVKFPTPAFYLLPTRAWELGIGTIAGVSIADRQGATPSSSRRVVLDFISVLAVLMLLLTFLRVGAESGFPGVPALMPCLAAAFFLCAPSTRFNRHVLSSWPAVWIGRVSYSWYLWHWPLMSLLRITMAGLLPLPIGMAAAALSLLLASYTYSLVEQPFRRSIGRASGPGLALYAVSLAVCAVPSLALLIANGWPTRYDRAQKIDALLQESAPDACLLSYRETQPRTGLPCFARDKSSPALAVMGDSHAAALVSFLRIDARAKSWLVDDFTKTSCPQLGSVTRYDPGRTTHARECAEFNHRALEEVISTPEIRTVLLAGFWSAPFSRKDVGERLLHVGDNPADISVPRSWRNFQEGLEGVVRTLSVAGKRVILVVDAPRFDIDPLLATRTSAIPLRLTLNNVLDGPNLLTGERSLDSTVTQADRQSEEVLRRVAQDNGAYLIDLKTNLCSSLGCKYEVSGVPLYVDQQHLSLAGAKVALSNFSIF